MMPYGRWKRRAWDGLPFPDAATDNRTRCTHCSWSCSSLALPLSRPRPFAASSSIPPARPSLAPPSLVDSADGSPVTTTADGRFEITAPAPGWRRFTITLAGFRPSDVTTFVPAPGTAAVAPGELRITLLPRAPGEIVSVTATRGQRAAGGGGARVCGDTPRPAARGVPCARRCAAERAGVQPVPSDLVAHGEPDGPGRIPAGVVRFRREPCAGAGGWRAAQRPVRGMGLLGPRAAGGNRARGGRARWRERPVRRRRPLGSRAGADAAAARTVGQRHDRSRVPRDAARIPVHRHGRTRVDCFDCG